MLVFGILTPIRDVLQGMVSTMCYNDTKGIASKQDADSSPSVGIGLGGNGNAGSVAIER